MAKDIETLKQQALQIKNEVEDGANTADRVGGMFGDMLDYNEEKLTELSSGIRKDSPIYSNYIYGIKIFNNGELVKDETAITSGLYPVKIGDVVKSHLYRLSIFNEQKQYVKQIFTKNDWNKDSEYIVEENGFVCAEFIKELYPMYINDNMYVENLSYYDFTQVENSEFISTLKRLRVLMPENYPFKNSNSYSQAILGLYIKNKEDDYVYILKSIRCAQHTESDADNKFRYEFIIIKAKYNGSSLSDINKLDGSYEETGLESQEQKNIQIINSVDFYAIIDWRLVGIGNG